MAQTFEVEVKSLLGSAEATQKVREMLTKIDPSCALTSRNTQLNHYFVGGSLEQLAGVVAPLFPGNVRARLAELLALSGLANAKSFSVRTRDKDGEVFLVVKASVGDDTSENGVKRMEFEEKVPHSLDELDELVLSAGFAYQAKWSREREEYVCKGVNVTLDKNAGYGWVAEFEKVVSDEGELEEARKEILALMTELGVEELPQDRLERMFAHYNAHWQEYYGTDRIFTIE